MGSSREEREAFVERLKAACDNVPSVIPPPFAGRQQTIAARLGVAPEAVSKWFKAVSMPRPHIMRQLADLLEVDHAYLALGAPVEMTKDGRKSFVAASSGASHLIRGLIMLAGGAIGEPAKSDPRAEFIDFYWAMRGQMVPVHVALARVIEGSEYATKVPKQYADVKLIAVVPTGPNQYHYLDLDAEGVADYKVKKNDHYELAIVKEGSKFITKKKQWKAIKNFVGQER